jgi:DUF1365 family protein
MVNIDRDKNGYVKKYSYKIVKKEEKSKIMAEYERIKNLPLPTNYEIAKNTLTAKHLKYAIMIAPTYVISIIIYILFQIAFIIAYIPLRIKCHYTLKHHMDRIKSRNKTIKKL